jgi:hypothetical protein
MSTRLAEAAVIGLRHAELGEEVGAAVALKPGMSRGAMGLRQGAGGRLLVPAAGVVRRTLAQRPDREDSQSRNRRAGRGGRAVTATVIPEQAADQAGPVDALLIDAALGPVRRFAPHISTARLFAALARRLRTAARRLRSIAAESGRIAIAMSTLATAPPHHPRTTWGWDAGGDYGAGAGPDGESDLAFAAVPEHADPETVMARVRALA